MPGPNTNNGEVTCLMPDQTQVFLQITIASFSKPTITKREIDVTGLVCESAFAKIEAVGEAVEHTPRKQIGFALLQARNSLGKRFRHHQKRISCAADAFSQSKREARTARVAGSAARDDKPISTARCRGEVE
jgi:hypothetical protein